MTQERGAPQRDREFQVLLPRHIPPIETLWFDVPLRPAPGNAVLIMLPHETMNPQTEIEFQGRKIKLAIPDSYFDTEMGRPRSSKEQPDVGIVARFTPETRWVRGADGEFVDTGIPRTATQQQIKIGMVVGVRPFSGAWFTHKEFAWIPPGRKIVITKYGVEDDLLFEVDFSDGEAA